MRFGMVPGPPDRRSAVMVAVSAPVSGLDAELRRLGYKGSTLVWCRGCWSRLESRATSSSRFVTIHYIE